MRTDSFHSNLHPSRFLLAAVVALTGFFSGCGSIGTPTPPPSQPVLAGNTQVAVLVSSTANDKWSNYNLIISSIFLVDSSGKQATVFSYPSQDIEFAHFNGASEPLAVATVPQAVYTSAVVNYSGPSIGCLMVSSIGGVQSNWYGVEPLGPYSVRVKFPVPITITGTAMALSLDLQIPESTNLSGCVFPIPAYSVTPIFTLSSVPISSQPTNIGNGKETGIYGRVVSLSEAADTFNLLTANGSVITGGAGSPSTFSTGLGTVFHGIDGQSGLLAGMFVDMDAAIQADGSFVATRVAVQDTSATNMLMGPLVSVFGPNGAILAFGQQVQGDDFSAFPMNSNYYSFDTSTAFQISSQFSQPSDLPFTPVFDATTMFAGQNVAIGSGAQPTTGPTYARASTITLLPQTLNGTIVAVSGRDGYQIYTISLAPYDPIPTLTAVVGQSTHLTNPNTIQVYVNGSAQLLNLSPLNPGQPARFTGLLFNDGGILRMVCLAVSNGVAE